jgi:hypothetical protein
VRLSCARRFNATQQIPALFVPPARTTGTCGLRQPHSACYKPAQIQGTAFGRQGPEVQILSLRPAFLRCQSRSGIHAGCRAPENPWRTESRRVPAQSSRVAIRWWCSSPRTGQLPGPANDALHVVEAAPRGIIDSDEFPPVDPIVQHHIKFCAAHLRGRKQGGTDAHAVCETNRR